MAGLRLKGQDVERHLACLEDQRGFVCLEVGAVQDHTEHVGRLEVGLLPVAFEGRRLEGSLMADMDGHWAVLAVDGIAVLARLTANGVQG